MKMTFARYFRTFCNAMVIAAALSTAACAPAHFARVQENSIMLSVEKPHAREVLFASSIDRFRLHPATRVTGGRWEVEVPKAEEFTYFYLVDNRVTLPDCQVTVVDDFGGKNCLFELGM